MARKNPKAMRGGTKGKAIPGSAFKGKAGKGQKKGTCPDCGKPTKMCKCKY